MRRGMSGREGTEPYPVARRALGQKAGQRLGVGCEVAVEVGRLELMVVVSEMVRFKEKNFPWSMRG